MLAPNLPIFILWLELTVKRYARIRIWLLSSHDRRLRTEKVGLRTVLAKSSMHGTELSQHQLAFEHLLRTSEVPKPAGAPSFNCPRVACYIIEQLSVNRTKSLAGTSDPDQSVLVFLALANSHPPTNYRELEDASRIKVFGLLRSSDYPWTTCRENKLSRTSL